MRERDGLRERQRQRERRESVSNDDDEIENSAQAWDTCKNKEYLREERTHKRADLYAQQRMHIQDTRDACKSKNKSKINKIIRANDTDRSSRVKDKEEESQ